MAVNINNAFVGAPPIDGGVYFNAPVGTTLPTSAEGELDKAFIDHGAIGPDGFNVQPTRNSDTEKMFGGGDWVDLQTEFTEEVTLTLLEDDNEGVIASIFGEDNVVITPGEQGTTKTIYHTKKRLPIKSHVLKAVDGDKLKTYVIPRGRITTAEKTADVHTASTKYNVTIKAFPYTLNDANGEREVYVVEYRDDGRPVEEGGNSDPAGAGTEEHQ
ncbi:hypothetical protein [Corynebacterium sp. CCUG 51687]|uniref:hypothetical protein n=1 Tax=Corynebacterium sp. CCUG 51687 TaxID=2823897 RepID=UPI0021086083|nr:hypothetical protein [Corynebacterium sp. CCUG 51687]MCQ4611890.1 hypothetical protein [Corynebacterium sp. CCUG 51687]